MRTNYIVYFDLCAFLIMAIFLFFLIVRKAYKGRTNLILFLMIIFTILATIGDMFQAAFMNYGIANRTNQLLVYYLNLLYFISHGLTLPLYVLYIYSSSDLWHKFTGIPVLKYIWGMVVALNILVLLLNGVVSDVYSVTEQVEYVRGSWFPILYIVAGFFGLWGFAAIIRYRTIMQKDKVVVLMFLYVVVIVGMAIQFVHSEVLVEMFATAMAFLFFMVVVKRSEDQIDPVTGAIKYNEGVERVKRNFISEKPMTISFIKIINHENLLLYLGQEKYNEFLQSVTAELTVIARENKYRTNVYYLERGLYAYVNDEDTFEKSVEVANQISKSMNEEMVVSGFTIVKNCRVCVARYPEDITDFNTLFTLGTTFHKTLSGKKDVSIYKEFRDDINFKIRNELEDIIRRGLDNGRFEMYYQPIYSTKEDAFISAEALLRLKDEKYGFISPSIIIPAAEMNGMIHELGDFVANSVVKFVSETDMDALGLRYVEMNLSAAQCIEVDLVEKTINLLEKYNVDPERISIEITETAANINPAIVDQNIQKLHEYGIKFALDDYGTGYSNIKRVTSLPIDQVKLDKSFVDSIDDPQMWIVIQDTITMLKEMGKEILVEGVEEERVAKKFTALKTDLFQGCELIQGFYFCMPLPQEEFIEFIKRHRK